MKKPVLLVLAALAVAACREETAVVAPDPVPINEETLAHFCQMNIAEHGGPKGQIHLEGYPAPLFFAQVRDLVAYLKSPEREAEITAIYVSDMANAPSWKTPGENNWTTAASAHYVIDADVAGGMGAPEIVPFSTPEAAADFVARYGGSVVELDAIPDDAALAPVDLDTPLEEPA